ncbi:hypothetical protein [Caballeronia sp. GAFFF3]|uniref:hypothetical protein n=1 Tax=Caballeronia sp. GAFFF3 TaxID=2921759 RepID=UPI002028E310|nr:hypothetical protein [Caballeronia sp. GAFFF3]
MGVLGRVGASYQDTRREIEFSRWGEKKNILAAARRASIIFEPQEIADRLTNRPLGSGEAPYKISDSLHPPAQPFWIKPSAFLKLAQRRRPKDPEATASAFAAWIYSLYGQSIGGEEDRERGVALEPEILKGRRQLFGLADDKYLIKHGYDWRLIHNGLHIIEDQKPTYFSIGELRVGRQAMRVSPDLVYQNIRNGDVIIVEIKLSRMKIPTNLWPNIWGQLWCYSHLPLAREASNLTVIGEVWGESTGFGASVYMRASVRRDPRAPEFHRFFRVLFEIYCGRSGLK